MQAPILLDSLSSRDLEQLAQGTLVQVNSAVFGLFVGVTPGGATWVAYHPADYATQCTRLAGLIAHAATRARATEKAPAIDNLLTAIAGTSRVASVAAGTCTTCPRTGVHNSFRDSLSVREYRISGMCQTCQDSVFEGGE